MFFVFPRSLASSRVPFRSTGTSLFLVESSLDSSAPILLRDRRTTPRYDTHSLDIAKLISRVGREISRDCQTRVRSTATRNVIPDLRGRSRRASATRRSLTGRARGTITLSLIGSAGRAQIFRYWSPRRGESNDNRQRQGQAKEAFIVAEAGRDVRRKVETAEKRKNGDGGTGGREGSRWEERKKGQASRER